VSPSVRPKTKRPEKIVGSEKRKKGQTPGLIWKKGERIARPRKKAKEKKKRGINLTRGEMKQETEGEKARGLGTSLAGTINQEGMTAIQEKKKDSMIQEIRRKKTKTKRGGD